MDVIFPKKNTIDNFMKAMKSLTTMTFENDKI